MTNLDYFEGYPPHLLLPSKSSVVDTFNQVICTLRVQTTYLHRSNFYLLNGLQLEDFSVEPANCYSKFKVRIERGRCFRVNGATANRAVATIIQHLEALLYKDSVSKV